jgi:hypothetical protein
LTGRINGVAVIDKSEVSLKVFTDNRLVEENIRLQREIHEANQRAEAAEQRIRDLEGKSQDAPTTTAPSSEGEEDNDSQGDFNFSEGNAPFEEDVAFLDRL